MLNRNFAFALILLLMIPVMLSAQYLKKPLSHQVPFSMNDPIGILKANPNPGKILADGNYIAVDTMNNGLGAMSGTLNPLAFDPYSGTVCFIHRSYTATYAAGKTSGQLWYNISTNFGVTWSRVPGGINTYSAQMLGRYPSMSISNPTKGPNNGTIAFFSWPELNPAAFGWAGYAGDEPPGAGACASFIDQGSATVQYGSDAPNWASDNSADMFWVAGFGTVGPPALPYGIQLWTTPDFGTISKVLPPQWSDSALGGFGSYSMGGASWKGVQYMAVFSAFSTFLNPTPLILPGLSKSTNKGATWSNFKVCDFRKIPKLAKYDELLTFGPGYNQGDIHVDKNGYAHLIIQVADTIINATTYSQVALVDLFETATGWDATIITTELDTSPNVTWNNTNAMGGGQMGPSSYIAFDSTRTIMAVQYVNTGTSGYADIFLTYKLLNDTIWATPVNLTNSGSTDNCQTQLAPFLRTVSLGTNTVECTAFSMYGYEMGNTGPLGQNVNTCVAYLGAEKFIVTIGATPTFSESITVKDNGNIQQALVFGMSPIATDGIDPSLGELSLPPAPPAGAFDVRFQLPVTPQDFSIKDFRRDTIKTATWTMLFQPGPGGYPFTFTWDPASLPAGTFYLRDLITGSIVNLNMKTSSTYTLTNSGITSLKIVYTNQVCSIDSLASGWNILSVPVLAPDMNTQTLFPIYTSPTYGFNNGYVTATTLSNGKGYWLRYGSAANINICGTSVGLNTIPVVQGWNLIGPYEKNIIVANITTTPSGILSSQFYGYNNGYVIPATLQVGKGYWIRASQSGVINIPTMLAKSGNNILSEGAIKSDWGRITVTDNEGRTGILYSAKGNVNLSSFDLPPVPPAGIFDVRFSSNRYVETVDKPGNDLIINSVSFPVTIQAAGITLNIKDKISGKLLNKSLKNGESIILQKDFGALSIELDNIPISYAMYQNYPNPFNPSTTIKYDIPENTKVNLSIYNVLGELVQTLVNGQVEAGYHQIVWNAGNMASGIYFYMLTTDKYNSVKKLILMK